MKPAYWTQKARLSSFAYHRLKLETRSSPKFREIRLTNGRFAPFIRRWS